MKTKEDKSRIMGSCHAGAEGKFRYIAYRRKAIASFPDAEASVKLNIQRLYSCMGRVYTTSYSYILVSIFIIVSSGVHLGRDKTLEKIAATSFGQI